MSLSELPRLIGVLDLIGGVAVRAVAGRRAEYRPVESRLCSSADPHAVAAAFRHRYGIDELYVADLDSLLGRRAHWPTLAVLSHEGFRITADLGVRSVDDLEQLIGLGIDRYVVALETLPGPTMLEAILEQFGPHRLVFSLDLADGIPLADPAAWGERSWNAASALRLAERAVEIGVEHMIVLDLRSVGTAAGPTTGALCSEIKKRAPRVQIWTGGGIRSENDVRSLQEAGASGVLVASALHDGCLESK